MKKRIMLYFGSFNPPHTGHLAIAEYALEQSISDEVWFVVSPVNPLKQQWQLAPEADRLSMTELTVAGSKYSNQILVCDVEFRLPRPSYTIDTLHFLAAEFPDLEFSILMGSDIPAQFEQWKSWREIAAVYTIYVYPRRGYEEAAVGWPGHNFKELRAPVLPFSSTLIRQIIEHNGSIEGMVADGVAEYIATRKLYGAGTAEHYLESGKAHYTRGEFGAALNDFMRARELGDNGEAATFEELVRSILEFRYTDIYNP